MAAAACLSESGMLFVFRSPSFAKPAAIAPDDTSTTSRPWPIMEEMSEASRSMRSWSSPCSDEVSTALPTLITILRDLEKMVFLSIGLFVIC
jgi:hypothetical protein